MLHPALKFYAIGFTIAALEEFITQGVLKNNFGGWIIPTIIAFLPFLIVVRSGGQFINQRFPQHKAALMYYLMAGGIGLALEWFLIGLSPWSKRDGHALAMLVMQVAMFSFWSGVAFAPRLLLDHRDFVAPVRRRFKSFLVLGMAVIYGATFLVPKQAQFVAGIVSVLITFISLNFFYFQYFKALKRPAENQLSRNY